MGRINFLVAIIILLFPLTTGAIPQLLNHQGYMANNNGTPTTGSADVTFNLYADETEGESIWTQTISVTFDGGYYSVVLGPGTPELSVTLFDGSELYLGTTLDGQSEFMPRMKLTSVPYAFRVNAVEGEVKAVGGLVVDGVEVINAQRQWIGTSISFADLSDLPEEWADGDDLGLEGSGTDGTLAQFTESGMADSVIVENGGKIGVGTDDPQSTFHVAGGVQIADDSGDCAEGREGTLRWHEDNIEVCDGTEWKSVSPAPMNGQSEADAGTSCKTIMDAGASQGDGLYWIDPDADGSDAPFQAFCNMTLDGGGWILAEKDHGGSNGVPHSSTNDYNLNNLLDESWSTSEGKFADARMKKIWLAGERELLWQEQSGPYIKMRFSDSFISSTWSTNLDYRNRPSGVFQEYFRYSNSTWYAINGHYNNWHFSNYNDNMGSSPFSGDRSARDQNDNEVYWATRGGGTMDNGNWIFHIYIR